MAGSLAMKTTRPEYILKQASDPKAESWERLSRPETTLLAGTDGAAIGSIKSVLHGGGSCLSDVDIDQQTQLSAVIYSGSSLEC